MAYKNPEDRRAYDREWHKKNAVKRRKVQRTRQKDNVRWFREEIKSKYSCAHCGENDPVVIDFHHNDPELKILPIVIMLKNGYGRKKILEEVEKCTPLCANCHRREEHRIRQANVAQSGRASSL